MSRLVANCLFAGNPSVIGVGSKKSYRTISYNRDGIWKLKTGLCKPIASWEEIHQICFGAIW